MRLNAKTLLAGAVALAAFGAADAVTSKAEAKQCIWNKSGFVMKAAWYNPTDIILYQERGKSVVGIREGAKPVQVDQWPTLQGRCTRDANENKVLTVQLSVVGGQVAADFAKVAAGTVAAVVGSAVTAAACVGSAGTACPAVAAGAAAYTAAIAGAVSQIPDAKATFLITTPSTTNYLDVWGTVWQPAWGPGGRI